ncbi:MAG: MATE family efflux transporter [Clostridia bacterium]|nr:MATE family efflux transporter [Clostridia bacterium]
MEGKDLTQGNLLSNMINFCIPLLITNLLNSLYNIVDGIWVGRLIGEKGVASVTNCWPIILAASSILSAISVTASIMVANKFASKEREKIKEIITPIYIVAILLGLITSGFLIVTLNMWLKILNTPEEILLMSKQYLVIYLIGYIFNFFAYTIVESIRATGNSKAPLVLLTLTNIINIILDPIFILIGLGIIGAALASSVAMICELVISLIYISKRTKLLKFNKKYMKLKKNFLKEVGKIGFPMMFAELSTIFTIILEVYLSNSLGVIGSSAYGIVSKLQSFLYTLGTSIKSMMTVIVAQFIGKGAFDQLNKVMKNGVKIIIVPTVIIAIFLVFCSRWFCSIFTTNEQVIEMSIEYLSIVGIAFVLIPICLLLMGFVLGTGNTKYSFITLFIASVVEFVVVLLIQCNYNKPLLALGVSILAWYVTDMIFCTVYYFSKKWRKEIIAYSNEK